MVRRCSDKMAKTLLVVFNCLFLVCGIVLLVVGLMDFRNARNVSSVILGLNSVNVATIVVGVIVVVISFLGCCGALKENSCMLNTFLGLLMIILVAEVAVGYLAFKNRGQLESVIKENALKSLNQTTTSDLVRETWDDAQLTWSCCGVNSFEDWGKYNLSIPSSCCKREIPANEKCNPETPGFNRKGCFPQMKKFAENNSLGVGVAAIIIAFIEVTGIIFACCLRSAINERYETV